MNDAKKILIVEDHTQILQMMQDLFTQRGYAVDAATNGEIGLQYAQQGGYAAVILDLKMPAKDGLELLKDLHTNPPQVPNGPIVIFSSVSFDAARNEAMRLGAAAFIAKDTLEPARIVDQIEELINQPVAPNGQQ